jgi:hypothetical protein
MYEIIADPEEYGIEALEEGLGNNEIVFPEDDRRKWAEEIGIFGQKLTGLAEKAKYIQKLFIGQEAIRATPASLKTFKVQLFKINDALETAINLADKIETEIVKK